MHEFGFGERMRQMHNVVVCPPLGYLEFLELMSQAKMLLTDSGGIQEETTILQVPCLTLRDNTERPVTVAEGTNTVVGNRPERIVAAAEKILAGETKVGRVPMYWDGRAAERIVRIMREWDKSVSSLTSHV